MADTKQATPELEHSINCPERNPMSEEACTCGLYWRIALQTEQTMHAAWRKRAEEAEVALSSRYGLDRTTPERKETCMHGTPISVNCGNCEAGDTWPIPEAGPDRGQQDAPGVEVDGIGRFSIMLKKGETLTDIADELAHVAEQAVMPPLETHVEALQITMKFAADKLRQFMAKAAREGQAPKGDRIKVEREPGCKCEYAIWTNAKGCPLHDVSDPVQAQKE